MRDCRLLCLLSLVLLGFCTITLAKSVSVIQPVVVMIDPGHGGKDPGAIGQHGGYEKNVVLGIGRYVRNDINNTPGMIAYMTRSKDRFIPLKDRLTIARDRHADLFVSIHADAYHDRRAHGASVYVLSELGASNEKARWLANQNTESEYLNSVKLQDKNYVLRSMLIDLAQTRTDKLSEALAKAILQNLRQVTQLNDKRVEHARFVVLRSPDVPSILIETGFISNPVEAKMLKSPTFQRHLAGAICDGIKTYILSYPPKTSLYYLAKPVVVKSGDSLYKIAERYHTTFKQIQQMNKLQNTHIWPGQVLYVMR